jgi:hypothetical protein
MTAQEKLAMVYLTLERDQRRPCSVEEAALFAGCNPDIIEVYIKEQDEAENKRRQIFIGN